MSIVTVHRVGDVVWRCGFKRCPTEGVGSFVSFARDGALYGSACRMPDGWLRAEDPYGVEYACCSVDCMLERMKGEG
jgi:hypothetical protein